MKKYTQPLYYEMESRGDSDDLDTKFNTIDKIQPFPYEISIILKNNDMERDHFGGAGFNEREPILYFFHNLKYNIIETLPIIKKNKEIYRFEINKEINKSTPSKNSYFISNGYTSTVVGIKYIKDTPEIECDREANNEPKLNNLVLKCKFVKNDALEKIKKKQDDFYMIYRRRKNAKSKFGNSIPECYFYGNDIKKEKYEPEIINEECDKPEKYDELFEDSFLEFSIWKYYTQKLPSIDIKKYVLLKLSVYLYYVNERRCYVNDLKFLNVGYDENNDYNIINIDYESFSFGQYKTFDNDKYILWDEPIFAFFFSCDIKKRLYLLLKLNLKETEHKIEKLISEDNKKYSDDPDINNQQKYNNALFILLCRAVNAKFVFNKDYKSHYLIDTDLHFEKFNNIGVVDFILCMFFKGIRIDTLIFNNLYDPIKLNPLQYKFSMTLSSYVSTFHNLNDVKILTYFIYGYIKPVQEVEIDYINALKSLMFDPITETGLLGTDFESVPPYELIAKKFKELNCDDMNIYEQFKKMIDDNIGTNRVLRRTVDDYRVKITEDFKITNVGFDVKKILTDLELLHEHFDMITYEEWQFANLVERLMDRPDNRSDTSLDLPSENSTLPQNYIFTINNETSEENKTIKWIKNEAGIYIESPEYISIKNNIESGICYIKKSKRQTKFDDNKLRKFGLCIVNFLKGKDIDVDGLSEEYLKSVELLKKFSNDEYIGTTEKPKPPKEGEYFKDYTYEELLRIDADKKRTSTLSDKQFLELSRRIRTFKQEKIQEEERIKKQAEKDARMKGIWARGQPLPQSKIRDKFRDKYLKYKNKYLKLKNKLNV